jgi:hypothetical protein
VCDNFSAGAGGALAAAPALPYRQGLTMPELVEEIEREYAPVRDKARDLREYL